MKIVKYILDRKKKLDDKKKKFTYFMNNANTPEEVDEVITNRRIIAMEENSLKVDMEHKLREILLKLIEMNDMKPNHVDEGTIEYYYMSNELPEIFDGMKEVKLEEENEDIKIDGLDVIIEKHDDGKFRVANIMVTDTVYGYSNSIYEYSAVSIYNIFEYIISRLNSEVFKNLNK